MEYAENKPGAYGYSRYCELYGQWKKKLNPTMRQRHRAGEKTFVDFSGKKPHIVDPKTGELVEMELFVGTLGASSYTYVEATLNQSLESWAKAHKGMSDYFGGSTEIWVPDNLKSGVDLVDRYEPGINRTYEELATHYGAVVVPARVFKPKDKAKVESAVQVAQRWILAVLRHRTFFSLAELNEATGFRTWTPSRTTSWRSSFLSFRVSASGLSSFVVIRASDVLVLLSRFRFGVRFEHHTIQTSRENVFHRAIAVRAQSFRSCASGLETLTAPAAA